MNTKFDTVLAEFVRADGAGVALGIVQDGQAVYAQGYGMANLEWGIPINSDTVFRWASLTKSFTAMAMMILMEQGKLRIHDLITDYLPEYHAGGHDVTFHHLLTHTSGIHPNFEFPDVLTPKIAPDFLKEISKYPFDSKPGAHFRYSNAGYQLLGVLIERIAGMSYGDFIRQHIFAPLGMNRSYLLDNHAILPRQADGYIETDGNFRHADYINMTVPYSSGGLGGTLDDLIKWDVALLENRLISESLYDQMLQPIPLADGTLSNYAYGWWNSQFNGHHVVLHTGGIEGFSSFHVRFMDNKLSIIILSNIENWDILGLLTKIARVALDLPEVKYRPYILGGDALAKCVGRYTTKQGMPVEVIAREGQILWKAGRELRLLPINRNEFYFVHNPDGTVTFGDEQDGVFTSATVQTPFMDSWEVTRVSN